MLAALTPDQAFALCRFAVGLRRSMEGAGSSAIALRWFRAEASDPGKPRPCAADDPGACLRLRPGSGWQPVGAWSGPALDLFELYRPLCDLGFDGEADRDAVPSCVIGHLGQSIDGRIATGRGCFDQLSSDQDLLHLHRLRALCDAIVVGANTVVIDNPRLTTRLVEGDDPLRVVLDPRGRSPADAILYRDGGRTLVVCDEAIREHAQARFGADRVCPLAMTDGRCDPIRVIAALRQRGCRSIFIEGGGETVSRFLQADALDRLQVAVAPLIVGDGLQGLRGPVVRALADCRRPRFRVYRLGDDLLWDFDLRAAANSPAADGVAESSVQRLI